MEPSDLMEAAMVDTVEVVVARGRSVMDGGTMHGPGTVLQVQLDDAAHLLAGGFVRYPDAPEPLPAGLVQLREGNPDGVGALIPNPSWQDQKAAADAEKAGVH